MAEEMNGEPDRTPVMTRRTRHRSAFPPPVLLAVLAVIAAVVVALWMWLRPEEPPETVPSAVADSVAMPEEEPFVLPGLGASDAVVRRLATEVASHPGLAEWLVADDLIRRFVGAVVDIARGSSPVPELEMLIPDRPYSVQRVDDRILTDPESHRRYDRLADVFTSVETEEAVELYRRLRPLFLEAYEDLGIQDGEFEELLARAMQNLLAVEVPEGPLELREAVGRYVYTNSRIESLTPAEKHLVRMGPDNARRVQDKLREISEALDLPAADPEGG